jgi:rhodanese-related sulfurtransferase
MIRLFSMLTITLGLMSCQLHNNAQKLDTASFKTLELEEDVFVIDIRTSVEAASAYLDGTDYFIELNSYKFKGDISNLDKNKTYIVYSQSGVRSYNALNYMENIGLTNLYELEEGMQRWSNPSSMLTKL